MTSYAELPKNADGFIPDLQDQFGAIYRIQAHNHIIKKRTGAGGWEKTHYVQDEATVCRFVTAQLKTAGAEWVHTKMDGSTEPWQSEDFAVIVADATAAFDDEATADQLNTQYGKAQAGALEMIKFGAMIGALETEFEGPKRGPKSIGLKGWLEAHCPDIPYTTSLRYRDLAKGAAKQLEVSSVARLSEALTAGEEAGASDADQELYEEVKGLVFGKSARQLLFSFSSGRGPGRPKGSKGNPNYKPITTAEAEEMATVELEGIVRDLASFISRHMHLKVVDVERRKACRRRLEELADVLK